MLVLWFECSAWVLESVEMLMCPLWQSSCWFGRSVYFQSQSVLLVLALPASFLQLTRTACGNSRDSAWQLYDSKKFFSNFHLLLLMNSQVFKLQNIAIFQERIYILLNCSFCNSDEGNKKRRSFETLIRQQCSSCVINWQLVFCRHLSLNWFEHLTSLLCLSFRKIIFVNMAPNTAVCLYSYLVFLPTSVIQLKHLIVWLIICHFFFSRNL